MDHSTKLLRSLLIPTQAGQILLPSAVVLEVLPYVRPKPRANAEEWFLGTVPCQGQEIPVVSFDSFVEGITPEPGSRARVAALKPIARHPDLECYGLLVESVPRLVTLQRMMLVTDESKAPSPGVLSYARLAGQTVCIPDLAAIEDAVVHASLGEAA